MKKKSVKKRTKNPVARATGKSLNCGLYSIPDNRMFDKDSLRSHKYVVFFNDKNNVDRVVETTHLYEKDKVNKILKNQLKVFNFKGEQFPAGVNNNYFTKNIDHENITIKNCNMKRLNSTVEIKDAKKIYNFAKTERK